MELNLFFLNLLANIMGLLFSEHCVEETTYKNLGLSITLKPKLSTRQSHEGSFKS